MSIPTLKTGLRSATSSNVSSTFARQRTAAGYCSNFYGLAAGSPSLTSAAESTATLLQERAAHGLAPPVRGVAYGFVATEWLEGTPLRSEAPPPGMAETLGAYIARVAGPQLTAAEQAEANARLAEMIYVNTREACGEQVADKARRLRPARRLLRLRLMATATCSPMNGF